eukprot:TRINITY_DN2413_c0_g2_i1.p1 TRINITY_DN2413_c0_g2~~TRINITY_DN2413_c0_g2_i1.p1  ORF type:complete len:126 (+),score=2.83 TRINITY_DN2413_c0_g2_i1:156-533(+)
MQTYASCPHGFKDLTSETAKQRFVSIPKTVAQMWRNKYGLHGTFSFPSVCGSCFPKLTRSHKQFQVPQVDGSFVPHMSDSRLSYRLFWSLTGLTAAISIGMLCHKYFSRFIPVEDEDPVALFVRY